MKVRIIGIDCATAEKNIGLALGTVEGITPKILEVKSGGESDNVIDLIAKWIQDQGDNLTLLSLDAPLGWPSKLGRELVQHYAGYPINEQPDEIFNRFTDKFVKEKIKRRPLEIGANLIARTAHAALKLLEELRQVTGHSIPLAWNKNLREKLSAIEVYPAATLIGKEIPASKYKERNNEQKIQRKDIIYHLRKYIHIKSSDIEKAEEDANILDSIVCVLAGADFILGKSISPDQLKLELAKKEGWIWFNHSGFKN